MLKTLTARRNTGAIVVTGIPIGENFQVKLQIDVL